MAIRLRMTEIGMVALEASRSDSKAGDVFLGDDAHGALADKFALDFAVLGAYSGPQPLASFMAVIQREESL